MSAARFFAASFAGACLSAGCGGDYWLGGLPPGVAGTSAGGSLGLAGQSGGGTGGQALATSELGADIVLTGDDMLELGGDGPCVIEGHGHSIRSISPWHGHVLLRDCTLIGLGSEQAPSIELAMDEMAWTKIEGCTFDGSGRVWLENNFDSTSAFTGNTILDSALLAEPPLRDDALPIFAAEGWDGTGQKTFQGNKIFKGFLDFGKTTHWLIGGSSDSESNIIVGRRGGIVLYGSDFVVRGNYVHDVFVTSPDSPLGNQESALSVVYETTDVLVEHNLFRKGHWVVRGITGEFRYNAVIDPGGSGWLQQPFENTKVHHNLFLTYAYPGEEQGVPAAETAVDSGLSLVNFRTTGIEVYANTFDGGGALRRFVGPALSIDSSSFLDSLRSNVFMCFPFELGGTSGAAIRAPLGEDSGPAPARLGYADYNLFFNPDAAAGSRNYALSVSGLTERADAGFGLNDARPGGPIDEQV
ncbi:MAG TPA: hypothetical protein VGP93_12925, partial [Polyangiaceae bacterium]|nr:hypothetical protein [Polyangiaceae bacterium]